VTDSGLSIELKFKRDLTLVLRSGDRMTLKAPTYDQEMDDGLDRSLVEDGFKPYSTTL